MDINENHARARVSDYVNFGHSEHLVAGQALNRLTAFKFKRKDLKNLLSTTNSKLFIMLALSDDSERPGKKHLSLVIGSMLNYSIDMENLIVPEVHFTSIMSFSEKSSVLSLLGDITLQELREMANNFLTATNDQFTSTSGHKIKCYLVNDQDTDTLGLRTGNDEDWFAFMPVVRPARHVENTPFDRAYISLAISLLDSTGKLTGKIIEYCLPCPTACATNYWFR